MISADPINPKALTIPVVNARGLLPQLEVGEILEGRAIEYLGDQRILIGLKDTWVVAETQSEFLPGETFMVQVKQLTPKIVLNLLVEPALLNKKLVSQIRALLPYQMVLGKLLADLEENIILNPQLEWSGKEKLQTILSSLIFNQNPGDYFKNFISASGLCYENKLLGYLSGVVEEPPQDDLKGILLKLLSALDQKHSQTLHTFNNGSLAKLVSSGVKNIELQQFLHILTKEMGDFYFFQIPVASSHMVETIDLYLYNQREKSDGKRKRDCFTLVFLLNLKRLGELKIVTFVAEKTILCRIMAVEDEIAAFIQLLLPQLKERLENLGYQTEALIWSVPKEASDQVQLPGLQLDDILERINSLNLWI